MAFLEVDSAIKERQEKDYSKIKSNQNGRSKSKTNH
jgi:hypothetical protein